MLLNWDDLARAAIDMDLTNEDTKAKWRSLYKVYREALDAPPFGVIGVGAITYAESKLLEAQQDNQKGTQDD